VILCSYARCKEVRRYEDDIPAKEEIKKQSSWLQTENAYC